MTEITNTKPFLCAKCGGNSVMKRGDCCLPCNEGEKRICGLQKGLLGTLVGIVIFFAFFLFLIFGLWKLGYAVWQVWVMRD